VEGCLIDIFLFTIDFLREDRVGSEGGAAGALPLLTTSVKGQPCSLGVFPESLTIELSSEEIISSTRGRLFGRASLFEGS